MDNQVHNSIVSFIWGIADDCLRDVYVRGKYRDVILPMTVIRRLDALLEETKPAVLEMKKQLDAAKIDNQWPALCNAAGQAFCNASPFLLKDLTSRSKAQTLKADFTAYLDGFSPNVQVILDKFKFRNQIDTMVDADILGAVIEKFTSSDINLSPNPIYKDADKKILKHPGLDNHGMGTIFEELIRKFNEENNEEAGEHWTPRDVVELMVIVPVRNACLCLQCKLHSRSRHDRQTVVIYYASRAIEFYRNDYRPGLHEFRWVHRQWDNRAGCFLRVIRYCQAACLNLLVYCAFRLFQVRRYPQHLTSPRLKIQAERIRFRSALPPCKVVQEDRTDVSSSCTHRRNRTRNRCG